MNRKGTSNVCRMIGAAISCLLFLMLLSPTSFAAEVGAKTYIEGDLVVIRTTSGADSLSIQFSGQEYRYLGALENTIAFTPKEIGEYIIVERFSDGTENMLAFTVLAREENNETNDNKQNISQDTSIESILPEEEKTEQEISSAKLQIDTLLEQPQRQQRKIKELETDERPIQQLNKDIRIRTPHGTGWVATTEVRSDGSLLEKGSTDNLGMRINHASGQRREVTLKLRDRHVKEIILDDADFSEGVDIGLDEIPSTLVDNPFPRRSWLTVYAVDPTNVTFTSGSVKAIAEGTELYKCPTWDFYSRTCPGEWIKIMDLVPGEEYSVDIAPIDPGFGEAVVTTGIIRDSSEQDLIVSASIPSVVETNQNEWGVIVSNPTNTTRTIREINLTSSQSMFSTIASISPSSGWSVISATQIRWTGTINVTAQNATQFIFGVGGQSGNRANIFIDIDVALNDSHLTNDGYMTHIQAASIPYPAVYLLNATERATYFVPEATGGAPQTFTIQIDNDAGLNTIQTGTGLDIFIPAGWTNVSAEIQTGWTLGTIGGDTGSGWFLKPQTASTTIASGGNRNFTFSANPPEIQGSPKIFILYIRLLGPGSNSQREISTTLEPAVRVVNGTPFLDHDDDRYEETWILGGSRTVDQYLNIPAPFDSGGANRWGVVVVNPTDREVNVTQIDITSDQNVFNAITGILPSTTWSVVSASNIRWAGTQTIPPRSAAEFAAKITATAASTTRVLLTSTIVTTNGTLSNTGFRTSQSTGNIQYPSMMWINQSGQQSYLERGLVPNQNTQFRVRINNTGASASVPTNTWIHIKLPAGWKNVSAASQTGWTIQQVVNDNRSGGTIRASTSSTITAGSIRDLVFNATPPAPGTNSTYRIDTRLFAGTAQTTNSIIQTQSQLGAQVKPTVYGLNLTHVSDVIPQASNVSRIMISDIVKAYEADTFNFSVYNWRVGAYETIRAAMLGKTEENWTMNVSINRTVDPRDYLNTTIGAASYGLAMVRWRSTSSNATALFEDYLTISFDVDDILPIPAHLSPNQGANFSVNTTVFSYNASDNIDIRNCSLFINGAFNQTNTTPVNGSANTFTLTNLSNRVYNWSIGCYDLIGHWNRTDNRSFTIDTVAPRTFLFSPANGSRFITQTISILFNVTEINLANCSLYVNNTLNQTNTSVLNATNSPFSLVVGDGSYNWTVECVDYANNTHRNSSARIFNVDTTAPAGSAPTSEPTSGSAYNQSQIYRFNATFTDANGISTVIFESNFSGTLQNRTVNVSVGSRYSYNVSPIGAGYYVWRMYANDSFGNNGSIAQQVYIVSRAASSVDLLLNGTSANYPVDVNETVNITGFIVIPATGYIELYVNGTLVAFGSTRLENITAFNSSGSRNITVIYNQTQNYSSSFKTLFITVGDKSGPIINKTYPTNNSHVRTTSVAFRFNLSDATGLGNCTLYVNGSVNATNTSVLTNNAENTITGGVFTEGNYTWALSCYDTIDNTQNTSNTTFVVDLTSPTAFSNIAPINNTISTIQSPAFSWTASSDTYFDRYTLVIDNAIDFSSPNFQYNRTGPANTSITIPDSLGANTIWYWRVVAYDLAGNTYTTERSRYTVDTVAPVLTIVVPANNTYQNTTTINITYSFSDLTNVTNCTVFFNDSTSYSNTSLNQTGTNTLITTKSEGVYLWWLRCVDSADNVNITENYRLTVDITPPTQVTLLTPSNNTFSSNNVPLLTWTQSIETNFKNYSVLVSDNQTFPYINLSYEVTDIATPQYQVVTPWPDGTLYWKIIVWDLAGNSIDPFHAYTIDSTPPTSFSLLSPPDGTSSTNRTPSLHWEQTNDTNFQNYTVLVTDDATFATVDFTYYLINNTNTTYNVSTPWPDNTIWYWRVIASDTANNTRNSSQTFTYITDNTNPVITLIGPTDGTTLNSNTSGLLIFGYNVSDLSDVSNCSLLINDSVTIYESTDYFIEKDQNQTFQESLATGEYNWSIRCFDDAGNVQIAGPRSLSVNVTLPKMRLYDTANQNSPQINVTGRPRAVSVYASNDGTGLTVPRYRLWNGTNWSAEGTMNSAGSNLRWIKMASNPLYGRFEETIAVTVSDDGNLDAYVWNGSTWSTWNNIGSIGTTSNADRAFDIEYETQRGRAMVVYSVDSTNGAQDMAYRIWNGTGWMPETFIDDGSFATDMRVGYIRIARNPTNTSNELAIAYIDATNSDGRAAIWNGAGWGNFTNITTAIAITTEEDIGIAYEQESKDILAVAGTGTVVAWSHWNGSSWNDTGTIDINTAAAGTTNFMTLKPNPEGDEMMLVYIDSGNDLSTGLWTGNLWSGALRHDAAIDSDNQRDADFEWEQTGDAGILVWGTTAGLITYRQYSIASSWQGVTNVASGSNTHTWIALRRIPDMTTNSVRILGIKSTTTSFQLDGITWDGSNYRVYENQFATSQGALTYQRFDLVADWYPPILTRNKNGSLNTSVDGISNIFTLNGEGLRLLTNMTSATMSNYSAIGFFLPLGAKISFTNLLESTNPSISYLTFAAYKVNSSGETLLCARGNYTATQNEVVVTGTALRQYNTSCIVSDQALLQPGDRLRVYAYANSTANNTLTKHIDSTSTYVEFEGYILGTLNISLIQPANDPLIGEGENMTLICSAQCTNGYCLNVRVSADINNTPSTFTPLSYFTGNILLNETFINPTILGTINITTNATFNLTGNLYSLNNTLICNATSDWMNATSNLRNVSVLDKVPPNITLLIPANGTGFEPSLFTFTFNASDRRLGNCTLWGNWSGSWAVNQTTYPNNGSPTSFQPINISEYGAYQWNVNCTDFGNNDAYAANNFTFTIAGDLAINSSDITFFPASPIEGANVTIYANVRNRANRIESNFNVSFWIGNPLDGGYQIGSNATITTLAGLSNITVNMSYPLAIGTSNIYVLVDPPYGSSYIFESDETNNIANNTITISVWQIYYGNASGNVTLGNSENLTLASWTVLNQSGNLYVSDTDTINGINFASLRPIGRNTTGDRNALTDNDFEEIDASINTTNLTENVNNSFTSNGDPIELESFNVFTTTVNNVAVFNSTPSGNFTTGILWDSDDSSNSYYDETDAEDVVFVAKVKTSINSTYGFADYEIRVPSRLKNYKGTTATVTFYYEIQ